MVRVLAAALTAAGLLGVKQEDVAPFVDRGFDGSMDITIPGRQLALPRTPETAAGFHVSGRNALLDITIMDPSTSASRVRSALERGHTAGKGYGKKITHYSPHFDATRHTLFPISIELFGHLHPISKQFFSAVSLYQHNRSGGAGLLVGVWLDGVNSSPSPFRGLSGKFCPAIWRDHWGRPLWHRIWGVDLHWWMAIYAFTFSLLRVLSNFSQFPCV
jgi:hypothetical protein